MFKIMLTLHLLAAILVIGPLVHAVTTSVRGLRTGDATATASSARMMTIYSYGSILVVVFGFGLMSVTSPYTGEPVAEFGETWIWLSALLWLVGVVIALTVTAPALEEATTRINDGSTTDRLTVKVSTSGVLVAVLLVAIVVLMVYQPS